MKKFKIGDVVMLKPGYTKINYTEYKVNEPFTIIKEWITGDTGGGWCYMKEISTGQGVFHRTGQGVFQCDLIFCKVESWKQRLEK